MRYTIQQSLIAAMIVTLACARGAGAQQVPVANSADSVGVVGKYDLSITPQNGETVTGDLAISLQAGAYRGVLTSPRLSRPADADSVRVTGHHVFVSVLAGAYTFAFDVDGDTVSHATYTKQVRDTIEGGALTIRKLSS